MRWLSIAGGIILACILALVLLLTYLFPSELVRKELEARLSDILEASVRIETLSFNLLNGLELKRVAIHKQATPLIQFDRLTLDYRLLALLKQEVQINEVLIDNANISLNLKELSGTPQPNPTSPPPPPPSESSNLPVLPVSVNLERFVIGHAMIQLVVNPTLFVGLTDLNVNMTGQVTKEAVTIAGSLEIQDLMVNLEEKHLQLPVDLAFSLQADLTNQQLQLHHVTLQSAPAAHLTLSGTIHDMLASPSVDLSLKNTGFDLKHFLAHVADFVPPDLQDIQVAGQFTPEVTVHGQLLASGFNGDVTATLEAQGIQARLAPFETTIKPMHAVIMVSQLNIRENVPKHGAIAATLSSENVMFQNYAVSDFQLDVEGNYAALGPVSASMKTSGVSVFPSLGPLPQQTLPFNIALDAMGNYQTQALDLKQLVVQLGDMLGLEINGTITPVGNPTETINVSLSTRLTPQIDHLASRAPTDILQGITISKSGKPDMITIDVTGMLDPEYQPLEAKFSAGVELQGISITHNTPSLTGTFDDIQLLLSGRYHAQTGRIRGTVSSDIQLSQFQQGNAMTLEALGLSLRSQMNAHLNPAYEITALKSEDTLSVHANNIGYSTPSLQAAIDELRILSKTQEDLVAHTYKLHTLRITSPPLFDMSVRGGYQMANQGFAVLANLTNVDVGEILKQLQGEMVQDLHDMNPQGTVSLAIKGKGRVPQQADIDQLHLPLSAEVRLALDNIEGTFAQHQIQGAGGTISASLVPGNHPVSMLQTDLHVENMNLSPGLPLSHISDAVAQLAITGRDMDEIDVDQFHIGMKGANLNITGSVTGLKNVVTSQFTFGKPIEKVFAQIEADATVQFDEFQDLLQSIGLEKAGKAQMTLSMLKKEHGPLDVQLQLGGRDITLRHNGTHVVDIDGSIALRKRLMWKTASEKPVTPNRFHPSDVLAQLRSITGQKKSLRIDRLNLGNLTISNFSTDILFNRNTFKIQNLAMNILGGGLGGNIAAVASKTFGVSANLEAAQLDLNYLLDDNLKIAGDSLVDATIGISIFFEEEAGALDLSRTELKLFITHIGKEALDRLLLFLDPEGSNPTIVNARSKVRLANPSQVTMQLTRGMLGFEIQFSEGLLSSFKMDRIPAGSIKSFQTLTQRIPNWDTIHNTMAMIGAEFYGIDEEGNIVLQ
ncbi:MAG: hypothetical protein GKS05_06515 [Nitrospirales bacterium]|nr:hypothetical protein [Nitrospirales bacterium]